MIFASVPRAIGATSVLTGSVIALLSFVALGIEIVGTSNGGDYPYVFAFASLGLLAGILMIGAGILARSASPLRYAGLVAALLGFAAVLYSIAMYLSAVRDLGPHV